MRTSTKRLSLLVATAGLLAVPAVAAEPTGLEEVMAGLDQTGTPPPPSAEVPPPAAQPAAEKRPVPSYDGRPEAGTGDALVWVPRVVLFPLHAVAEYGIRRPVVGAVTWSEEHYLLPRVRRVFTSDDGKRGIYPYFLIDTGLRPRFGAVAFADSLFLANNDLRLTGNIAHSDVFSMSAQNRTDFHGTALVLRASYGQADDFSFYGSNESSAIAFSMRRSEGSATLEQSLGGLSQAALFVRAREAHFGGSGRGGADVLATHGGEGQPPLPAGFDGYQLLTAGTRVVLDSRHASAAHLNGSGVRFEADGSYSTNGSALRFAEWGGELGAFYDVSGHENVIGLRVAARFQENMGTSAVPFTERITLGGNETMRGFVAGRLRGDSAVLAEVQYRYAIWMFADAELFSGVGNTFEGRLEGFRPDALYWTSGLSLRTTFARDSSWAVGVAMGSRRLDAEHFAVADHVRFFAGLNRGF